MGRKLLEFARAGALAMGVACVAGIWLQGMEKLGLRQIYPNGAIDVFGPGAIGAAFAFAFGFPQPASGGKALALRVVGLVVATLAFGGLLLGAFFLVAGVFGVPERNCLPLFVAFAIGGIAAGLRRLPRSSGARVALAAVAMFFVGTRLLAFFPSAAHAVTPVLFRLPESTVRSAFDARACGDLCRDGRATVVSFSEGAAYHLNEYGHNLAADAQVDAALDVRRAYFEDDCGQIYDSAPEVPADLRAFPDRKSCDDANPPPKPRPWSEEFRMPMPHCCLWAVKHHDAGERVQMHRTVPFVLVYGEWKAQ